MSAVGPLGQVADRLASLGGLVERHFDAIGHSLEQAVGILAALTASFQTLLDDLHGGALAQSGQDLASVAARVGALSDAAQTDLATIEQLGGVTQAVDGRIAGMHEVLREIDILAMNARLVAATMGEAGAGFLPFAAEIQRSAGAARGGLGRLAGELAGARQHLQAAGQAAGAFVGQHAGTMQLITARLAASVASIEAHVLKSGDAASAVSERTGAIRVQVAAAIVSLQLGDITRQRIEHMLDACARLAQEDAPPDLICRLVAAQLLDVAEELERGAGSIGAELNELGVAAGDIARHGKQSYGKQGYGASSRDDGSFLDELESDTKQAQTLLGHLRTAHATVSPCIAAVFQSASRLVGHIATIRSVEADIHIMGLNTSLKCSRLGVIGRPLSVIAQAVRDCGRQTAVLAAVMLDALRRLLAGADSLAAMDAAHGADDIDSAADRMTAAVHCLNETAARMGSALMALTVDGERVARLLHTAVEGFAVHLEIASVLRDAAAACSEQAGQRNDKTVPTALLADIAASYTMAREREVHARFAPSIVAPAARRVTLHPVGAPALATEDAALADVLF